MNALPKNIILKELDNVSDHYLADILNYLQFLRSDQNNEINNKNHVTNEAETSSNAYPTINLNKPDYIIVTNHLN